MSDVTIGTPIAFKAEDGTAASPTSDARCTRIDLFIAAVAEAVKVLGLQHDKELVAVRAVRLSDFVVLNATLSLRKLEASIDFFAAEKLV